MLGSISVFLRLVKYWSNLGPCTTVKPTLVPSSLNGWLHTSIILDRLSHSALCPFPPSPSPSSRRGSRASPIRFSDEGHISRSPPPHTCPTKRSCALQAAPKDQSHLQSYGLGYHTLDHCRPFQVPSPSSTTLAPRILTSSTGRSSFPVFTKPILFTTPSPLFTLPNIVCFPSNHGVGANVMKN